MSMNDDDCGVEWRVVLRWFIWICGNAKCGDVERGTDGFEAPRVLPMSCDGYVVDMGFIGELWMSFRGSPPQDLQCGLVGLAGFIGLGIKLDGWMAAKIL